MVRTLLFCLLISLFGIKVCAQKYIDSLRTVLLKAGEDTAKVNTLVRIAGYHEYYDQDSNVYFVNEAITLSNKINYPRGILLANISDFFATNLRANYPKALEKALRNLKIAQELPNDKYCDMAHIHNNIGLVQREMGDTPTSIHENMIADSLQKICGREDGDLWGTVSSKGFIFSLKKEKDSALNYTYHAMMMAKSAPFRRTYSCLATTGMAIMCEKFGMIKQARDYFEDALHQTDYYDNVYIKARIYMNLVQFFTRLNRKDSATYFAYKALEICEKFKFGDYASTVADSLAVIYESQGKPDSALKYMRVMATAKDSIFSQAKMLRFQRLISENEQKQQEADAARERFQNKVKLYSSLAVIAAFVVLSLILYRNNRQKQKAYSIIRRQKQETEIQKTKVEQAYQDLKTTQNQLVHAEKMASLGELTAGIAHEIQNPLNFVNNFSEVNTELIAEMKEQINQGNWEEVKSIASGIEDNEKKIIHHGQRADGIVKSMLQHSRSSSSQKEPTDINAMADEYLRLAYHGFRAKEKDFNAQLETHFDPGVGKISLIPQDIGRVLLNAFNNAFYAMHEKQKMNGEKFSPMIRVSTQKKSNALEITIADNGLGIPDSIRDKIFQPFFTTKPAGQGTGLGLSLSYDIVTAHGGQIEMESKEGEGSAFKIQIPIVNNS